MMLCFSALDRSCRSCLLAPSEEWLQGSIQDIYNSRIHSAEFRIEPGSRLIPSGELHGSRTPLEGDGLPPPTFTFLKNRSHVWLPYSFILKQLWLTWCQCYKHWIAFWTLSCPSSFKLYLLHSSLAPSQVSHIWLIRWLKHIRHFTHKQGFSLSSLHCLSQR